MLSHPVSAIEKHTDSVLISTSPVPKQAGLGIDMRSPKGPLTRPYGPLVGEPLGTKGEADFWMSRSAMSVYDYKIQEATTNLKMNRSGAADTRPAERPRRKKAAIFSIVLRAPVRRDVLSVKK